MKIRVIHVAETHLLFCNHFLSLFEDVIKLLETSKVLIIEVYEIYTQNYKKGVMNIFGFVVNSKLKNVDYVFLNKWILNFASS